MKGIIPNKAEEGVPLQLLRSMQSKKIVVDTAFGDIYTGILVEAEDSMNLTLKDVSVQFASGHESQMINVYIRGAKIRYIGLPDGAESKMQHFVSESLKFSARGRRGRGGNRGGGRGGGRGGSRFGSQSDIRSRSSGGSHSDIRSRSSGGNHSDVRSRSSGGNHSDVRSRSSGGSQTGIRSRYDYYDSYGRDRERRRY